MAMKQIFLALCAVAALMFWSDASYAGGLGRDATHGMRRIGPRTPAAQINPSNDMPSPAPKKKKHRM
jgi:hypothetical protein